MGSIDKHMNRADRKEKRLLRKRKIKIKLLSDIEGKIPPKVRKTIDEAFYKGFYTVFEKGTDYIEKLYDKEKIICRHEMNNLGVDGRTSDRSIREIDRMAKRAGLFNQSVSTVEGGVLGLLGMGLPDIPLFIAVILKNVYEICLSYGFNYEHEKEKLYILSVIAASIDSSENRDESNNRVDEIAYCISNDKPVRYSLDELIRIASDKLSDALLVSKFIQGIPVVGVIGAVVNCSITNDISKYAIVKYKKRYLSSKL